MVNTDNINHIKQQTYFFFFLNSSWVYKLFRFQDINILFSDHSE